MDSQGLDNWSLIWLESWLMCCDKALANFLLTAEYGSSNDVQVFLVQFKKAKQCAIENMKDRK